MPYYSKTSAGRIRGGAGGGFRLSLAAASAAAPPPDIDYGEGVTLFAASVENADTVASWDSQELAFGQPFKKGDVPAGTIAIAIIDGNPAQCQVSERIFWNDGSLKHGLVRMLVPTMAAGGAKTITWQRVTGSWNDAALHTATSAITGNVTLEYEFTSWKGRTSADVLTAERGPLQLNSTNMLANSNATWTDKVMSGPLCNEWRVSDMATVGNTSGPKHANQGGYLYARAWGGTATKPRRIQFLFRTIYGWSTDVTADEQGLRVNVDLKVNGTTVRGASIGTTGWSALDTWKGGFLHSCDTDGRMDWFDTTTNSFVTAPKLIYRHNITYGVASRFVPPLDTNNPAINLAQSPTLCLPGKRGPLRVKQDDVADAGMIPWTVTQPVGNVVGVFARGTAAQIHAHMTTVRSAGWGMGAMSGIGLHRTTRKIINYLPPTKQTNLEVMGTSLWTNGTTPRPANAGAGLNNQISGLDAAHFPQMEFWPAMLDGDQHFLDLMYHEVTLPGVFGNNSYGQSGTSDRAKIPFGGIQFKGQIRGVGHNARPIVCAMGLGRPGDPHHTMTVDYWNHFAEMTREIPLEEDAWRGGLNATDGRRFQDLKLLWPNNQPQYRIWMHSFGLHALSYGWAITESTDVKERADWWSHAVVVTAGGYHNDPDPLMKCDPYECMPYFNIAMDRNFSPIAQRRWYHFGQWRFKFEDVIYKADGQTIVIPTPDGGSILDGQIITVSALRNNYEPMDIGDPTKFPTSGLVAGTAYYAVQANGTSCKLSLTLGGTPVTFDTGGVDIAAHCTLAPVAGWHPATHMAQPEWLGTGGADYPVHVGSALDFYQWYCAPDDRRVALARNNVHWLKSNSLAPTVFDPRGGNVVPRIPTWRYTSALGGYIHVKSDAEITLLSTGGTATTARRYFPTTVGQSYKWTFTTDTAVERRIGTAEDGAQILANASVTGSFTHTFTATTTQTWVYLQRLAAGTVNVTAMTFGPA